MTARSVVPTPRYSFPGKSPVGWATTRRSNGHTAIQGHQAARAGNREIHRNEFYRHRNRLASQVVGQQHIGLQLLVIAGGVGAGCCCTTFAVGRISSSREDDRDQSCIDLPGSGAVLRGATSRWGALSSALSSAASASCRGPLDPACRTTAFPPFRASPIRCEVQCSRGVPVPAAGDGISPRSGLVLELLGMPG